MSTFKDSVNIIIENDGPKYYYPGDSYLEKLKNGIPLEYVFELENHLSTFKVESCVSDTHQAVNYCLNSSIKLESTDFETDELDESDIFPKERKGKWLPLKKTVASNFKKNTRRQNGYNDKLFNREQNTTVNEEDEEDTDLDDDSSCWSYGSYGLGNYGNYIVVHNVEGYADWWRVNNCHLDAWH